MGVLVVLQPPVNENQTRMDFMTKQESYAERRQLFKNIWDTAMNIEEKDDMMNKPKVIKTLRLDEVDKCVIGRKKKQRIKNLRHVCNKILDFCERQDADDVFYEQMVADGLEPMQHKIEFLPKKTKTGKIKKKMRKAKSMSVPLNEPRVEATTAISERNDMVTRDMAMENGAKISRNNSPIKSVTIQNSSFNTAAIVKSKINPENIPTPTCSVGTHNSLLEKGSESVNRCKTIRKKNSKRKKQN